MKLTKKLKNYSGTRVITLSKEERELMHIEEGDILKIEVQGIYKHGLGLPTPPEIDDQARYRRAKEDGE